MPAGRPSKYYPELADKVIELMKTGVSREELCYQLNIAHSTLQQWEKNHPEFSAALKDGTHYSCGWWMGEGRLNIKNKEFNSGLWFMNMKNRFNWSDKREVKQETNANVSISQLEDLEKARKAYQKDE